jgi:gluconolactonase
LPFNGVYRIPKALYQKPGAPPARTELQLLVKDLTLPNGIAFSPDEKYLYVNNSGPRKIWMRYPVKGDGTLAQGVVLAEATSDPRRGIPDGMKVDQKGNIYSTGPGGIWVLSPSGRHLGTICTAENVGNMAWGGADAKTLYIMSTSNIFSVRTKIPGMFPKLR